MINRAIFLDRDGTLNPDSKDYIKNLSDFQLFPFTAQALVILKQLGFKLFVITNQVCIAKGLTSIQDVEDIHTFLINTLAQSGVLLDGIYYCPHHPDDDCDCRKPRTGMVIKAASEYDVDLAQSWFIGDTRKDIETGAAVCCKTILVQTGVMDTQDAERWNPAPDFIVRDLLEAARMIQQLDKELDE